MFLDEEIEAVAGSEVEAEVVTPEVATEVPTEEVVAE